MPFVLLGLLGERAQAQETAAHLSFSGGVATDQRGVRSNALSVAPGLTVRPNHRVAFQLGGNATRFGTNVFSFGAGASLQGEQTIGRFVALTLGTNGSASRLTGATGAGFAQGDIVPALELRSNRIAVFAGVRAGAGIASQQVAQPQPGLPIGPPRTGSASVSRAGAGPVFGAALALGTPQHSLRLGWRDERLRIERAVQAERTLSAAASLALTGNASLELAAGRYDANRLLGTPSGEYLSAGIAFRFAGASERPLPRAIGAPRVPAGLTRLSIRAPEARRVEIAGDFNEWKPAAALRAANGVWYADLEIPPGQYRYAFRIDGTEWRVPDGATAVDDGFGGKSAWLTIPETRSR